jgi:hypothetical protein
MALPTFLPSWHFYFYLQALESVLFGVGLAVLATAVGRVVSGQPLKSRFSARAFELGAHLACIASLSIYVGSNYERYRWRLDLVAHDAGLMFEDLRNARWSEFSSRAKGHQLRYVTRPPADREKFDSGESSGLLRVLSASDADRGYDVYELSDRQWRDHAER